MFVHALKQWWHPSFDLSHYVMLTSHTDNFCRHLKSLRPRKNGRYFTDEIFKWNLVNQSVWISNKILVKFVLHVYSALVRMIQQAANHYLKKKTMMVWFTDVHLPTMMQQNTAPGRRQTIIWTNAGLSSNGTNFSEIVIETLINKANLRDLIAATSLVISNRIQTIDFAARVTSKNNRALLLYYVRLCA